MRVDAHIRTLCYRLSLIIAAVGIGVMYAITPPYGDDLWYSLPAAGLSGTEAMSQVLLEAFRHWHYDTGRLANLINAPFLTIVPRWLFGLLSALIVVILVDFSRRIIALPQNSFRAVLLVVGVILFLPWPELMFTVVFALNYLWSSAFVIVAVWLIFLFDSRNVKRPIVLFASLYAVLAGWMHEGFTLPVIAGFIFSWVLTRHRPRRASLICFASFCWGGLLILISPSIMVRFNAMANLPNVKALWEMLFLTIASNCLFFAAVGVLVFVSAKRKLRAEILANANSKRLVIFLLFASSAALFIFIFLFVGIRMAWLVQMFSGLLLLYLIGLFKKQASPTIYSISTITLLLFLLLHLGLANFLQHKLNAERENVLNAYFESPTGQVFYDVAPVEFNLALYKPSYRQLSWDSSTKVLSEFYAPGHPILTVLPSALQTIAPRDLQVCKSDSTLAIYKGHLLSFNKLPSHVKLEVFVSSLGWIECGGAATNFSDSSFKSFSLIKPHISMMGFRDMITDARMITE